MKAVAIWFVEALMRWPCIEDGSELDGGRVATGARRAPPGPRIRSEIGSSNVSRGYRMEGKASPDEAALGEEEGDDEGVVRITPPAISAPTLPSTPPPSRK